MKRFVAVDEAQALIAAALPAPARELLPRAEAAGHILAEDLAAPEDLPAFTNSAMDGFAVRAGEVRGASPAAPVDLALAGEVAAGGDPQLSWPPGSCLRILTGAPAPRGTDGVVPVEETEELDGGRRVRFRADLARTGSNLRPAGEDVRAGAPLLSRGTRLGPAALGLLAAQGIARVPVYRRARVAFLATGDELAAADAALLPGQIRNSNGPMALAQLAAGGFAARDLGVAGDDPELLRERLAEGLAASDAIVTSGGVSMGRHDRVGEILAELGAQWVFHKVAQQPAKPLAFLTRQGKPVFGMPGNPVSGFLALWFYVLPALRRMAGDPAPDPRRLTARLSTGLSGRPGKLFFARAWTHWREDGFVTEPRPPHGSHVLSSLARANSFVLLPPGTAKLEAGSLVEVAFFEEQAP